MRLTRLLCIALAGPLLLQTGAAQQLCANKQTQQQIDARIDALIAKMTVGERILQLQDQAPSIPRLGVPGYNWWNEGLHGLARDGYATVFPQAMGLAATWDAALLHEVGDTVSTEARARFNPHLHADAAQYEGLTIWSPNINIFRDPRWGRGQETYGEDPFLTATLGAQFVEGIQGNDPFYLKADATPKHFVAHSGPEEGRDSFNTKASAHDLADTYLPAFHALITTANAAAMMCSYNAINGTPSCADSELLQKRVRDGWGFKGYVVSDCDAVGNITSYHHYTADKAHGAAAALKAGTDLDCGRSYTALNDAVAQGLVTASDIDRSLHRLLMAKMRLGMLDEVSCTAFDRIEASANDTPAHRTLALKAAEESIVLLKNDGVLPIKPATRVAVIGPTADLVRDIEANYHGTASTPVTPLRGLRARFAEVRYAQGSLLTTGMTLPIPGTALRVDGGPNAAAGLRAEFFTNTEFSGPPAVTQTVSNIDLDLAGAGPSPKIPAANYSARWTGALMPPAPGDYRLRVNVRRSGHSHAKLYLDNKLVIENNGERSATGGDVVHFTDTQPHALKFEFVETSEDGEMEMALEWEPPADALLNEAVSAASASDVIVAFVGLSPDLEGEAIPLHIDGFAGGDRTSLALPAAQQTLLARLQALHKPMIVVLNSGSAVALDAQSFNALLAAWYPGEEGGTALANILSGATSPSGRLPVTFYRSVDDLPDFSDYSMAHRTYRYFDKPVLYPFGYGLSYAHISYGPVKVSHNSIAAGDSVQATVTLRNTSSIAASEVAELYLVPPQTEGSPHLALAGTQRVQLAAGESRKLTFTLAPAQLSFVDPAGHRAVRSGDYRIVIGGAQPSKTDLQNSASGASVHITGEKPMDF